MQIANIKIPALVNQVAKRIESSTTSNSEPKKYNIELIKTLIRPNYKHNTTTSQHIHMHANSTKHNQK